MKSILKSRYLFQCVAAITGSLSAVSVGLTFGWTSPYLPKILNGTYTEISMTNDEGSWCAVMPLMGSPLGALTISALVDKFGRKFIILSMAPITALAFILLAFSHTFFLISLVRFIIGIVDGGLFVALPMYLGEISEPCIRGVLTATMGLYVILGTLLINIIGFYYSIYITSFISVAIPIIHFTTFFFMPESPYYFIKKGNIQEAENSLKILRRSNAVAQEIYNIRQAILKQETEKKSKLTDLFTVRSNRRAVIIFCILNLTRKYSGKHPFMFYTATIFQSVENSLAPNVSVIIYICIEATAACFSLILLDRFGRRPIIILSTIGCAIALCFSGLYFFLKDLNVSYIASLGWVPLLALATYNAFYTLGLELAQMIYLGELFPTNIKATALGLADTFTVVNSVVAAKLFQYLADHCGIYLPFWIFCGCCLIGLPFIIKYVPETKNKSLEQIQTYLIKKTSKDVV